MNAVAYKPETDRTPILAAISGGPLPTREIAERTKLTQAVVYGRMQLLVERGLCERIGSHRHWKYEITAEGREALEKADPVVACFRDNVGKQARLAMARRLALDSANPTFADSPASCAVVMLLGHRSLTTAELAAECKIDTLAAVRAVDRLARARMLDRLDGCRVRLSEHGRLLVEGVMCKYL